MGASMMVVNVKRLAKVEARMREAPTNVSYADLEAICGHYFGEPRQRGTSHAVFKMPWPGDPRINIQKTKEGKAKPYQIRQVVKAIDKLREGGEDK